MPARKPALRRLSEAEFILMLSPEQDREYAADDARARADLGDEYEPPCGFFAVGRLPGFWVPTYSGDIANLWSERYGRFLEADREALGLEGWDG